MATADLDEQLDEQLSAAEAEVGFQNTLARYWKEETRLLEAQIEILSNLVAISGEERETQWVRIAGGAHSLKMPYTDLQGVERIRNNSRDLAYNNPFAINIIENGKSYIYGCGHTYRVKMKDDEKEEDEKLIKAVREEIDLFRQEYPDDPAANGPKIDYWWMRQLETWERRERDGEVFRRMFEIEDKLFVRFVEPEQVTPRKEDTTSPFGIRFTEKDKEKPELYYVKDLFGPAESDQSWEDVPAKDIQHIKANVDMSAPRGVPTLYPIDANLRRAVRILRNMGTVTEMQAAIAWVQRHLTASAEKITNLVSQRATVSTTNSATGQTKNWREQSAAGVLHTNASMEYEPWAIKTDVEKIVASLQAELRCIASRVQYPEFMVSGDASNANYSSTMVAEGPAVKRFVRLQWECIVYDLQILYRAIAVAVRAGRLPADTLERIELEAEPPTVKTRNVVEEVQSDAILAGGAAAKGAAPVKVMSKKTFASRHELDYDREKELIRQEEEEDVKQEAKLAPLKPPPQPLPLDPNIPAKVAASKETGNPQP